MKILSNLLVKAGVIVDNQVAVGTSSPFAGYTIDARGSNNFGSTSSELYHYFSSANVSGGSALTVSAANLSANSARSHIMLTDTSSSVLSRFGLGVYTGTGMYAYLDSASKLVINNASGANVIIGGTTDAGYKLDINGTLRVQGNITVSNIGNLITTNQFYGLASNYANGIFVGYDGFATYLGYSMGAIPVHIGTNGTGDVRIKTSGNTVVESGAFLVGTTTAVGYLADINGTLRVKDSITLTIGNAYNFTITAPSAGRHIITGAYGTESIDFGQYGNTITINANSLYLATGSNIFAANSYATSNGINGLTFSGANFYQQGDTRYAFQFTGNYTGAIGAGISNLGLIRINPSIATSIGTINGSLLHLTPSIATTAGTTNWSAIYYEPTITTSVGLDHFFINAASGKVKLGNLSGTGSRMVVADATGVLSTQAIPSGTVTGTGTTNFVTKWVSSTALGNSQIFDDGTNVGIGTSTPGYKLDVAGVIYTNNSVNVNNYGTLSFDTTGNGRMRVKAIANRELSFGANNLNENMIIGLSGNVGINATSLISGIQLTINTTAGGPVSSGTAQTAALRLQNGANNGVIDFGTNSSANGWIQVTNRSSLDSNFNLLLNPNGGNVGIGTLTPAVRLSVQETANATAFNISNVSTAASMPQRTLASFQGLYNSGANGHQLYLTSGTNAGGTWEFNMTKTWDGMISLGVSADGTAVTRQLVVRFSNVGIGVENPAASAKLEIASTTQGFLPPRMTAAQRGAISSPATGLVVYQTDGNEGLWLYTVANGWRALAIVV